MKLKTPFFLFLLLAGLSLQAQDVLYRAGLSTHLNLSSFLDETYPGIGIELGREKARYKQMSFQWSASYHYSWNRHPSEPGVTQHVHLLEAQFLGRWFWGGKTFEGGYASWHVELKYLYIENYARVRPDGPILAFVNWPVYTGPSVGFYRRIGRRAFLNPYAMTGLGPVEFNDYPFYFRAGVSLAFGPPEKRRGF
ncbi:MAG: hypothetical protein AAFV95_07495 [Bacteroidota bacterium]